MEGTRPGVVWIHSNQDHLTDGQQEVLGVPGLGRMDLLSITLIGRVKAA